MIAFVPVSTPLVVEAAAAVMLVELKPTSRSDSSRSSTLLAEVVVVAPTAVGLDCDV